MYLCNYVRIYEFVHRVSKKRDLRCFKGFFCHISSKIFMNFYEILENSGMNISHKFSKKLYFFRKQTLFFIGCSTRIFESFIVTAQCF